MPAATLTALSATSTRRSLTATGFTGALDDWIAAGDAASQPRRRLVAAAFALDANWTATRTPQNEWLTTGDVWGRYLLRTIRIAGGSRTSV